MTLQDKNWYKLDGAYRKPYDASVPLMKMEQSSDPGVHAKIWEELWSNLHHQGNVGLASYMAIPQLVRITKEKGLVDWNLFGLCSLIEQHRHDEDNPDLPAAAQAYYQDGLTELNELALEILKTDQEDAVFTTALAAIATCSGRINLGKALIQLEDEDVLEEFLEQF
ncbi:MAG: hypothetical protein DI535_16340 [Citrobacter freundii]|nr:MAG: hypothetical protein DI535_16340 [Citrobacter freundii]